MSEESMTSSPPSLWRPYTTTTSETMRPIGRHVSARWRRCLLLACLLASLGRTSISADFSLARWNAGAEAVQKHPVSITRASVYLTREQANVRIDVFLEDLYLFHQLKPNREDFLEAPVIQQGVKLHEQFLAKRFEITDVEGNRYSPESVAAVGVELPAEGVPLSDLMGHQLVFELHYVFSEPPQFLTFTQRFTDEEAVLPSEMKLEVKQENAGAPYEQTLLPHIPYTLRIGWDNPPLSAEASERERADWAAREKEALLGITSYSSVYSFLYVEDYEVRHEILAPLLTLDEDLLISRDDDELLDVAEQNAARRQIESYFATGNPVRIDGELLEPVVQRCDFYGIDMKDFAQASRRKPVPLANARVGIILAYRRAKRPQQITMTWDRFNSNLWGVTAVVMSGDSTLKKKLSRLGDRNVLEWSRPVDDVEPASPSLVKAIVTPAARLSLPWLSLLFVAACLGVCIPAMTRRRADLAMVAVALLICASAVWAGPRWQAPSAWSNQPTSVSEGEVLKAFRQLHQNMYLAFHRRTEESIYDSLAMSVDKDLLRTVYLEIRRGLAMEDQGGAIARIGRVELLEAERLDPFVEDMTTRVRCRWNVVGTVEHWGHLHNRTHQYVADFLMEPVDGVWKLVAMEVLEEEQLGSETTLRQL